MRRAISVLLALLGSPAIADAICDDLWLSRNAVMDRAGFCFESPLGLALFDNKDCFGTDVTLTSPEEELLAAIQDYEEELACAVDTSATSLEIGDLDIRLRLSSIPVRDSTESACLGWQGRRALLLTGTYEGARVSGSVEEGDTILSQHQSYEDSFGRFWSYYTVTTRIGLPSPVIAAGWTYENLFETCDKIAG
ncbi:MAG: DUF4453 domain-containing protein [Pseudomonadota bacterium]